LAIARDKGLYIADSYLRVLWIVTPIS